MLPFAARLRADLAAGPMTVAAFMARCNRHYYATRDPLGRAGDFTTAPEISQMFGELIGAWLADQWRRAGSPTPSRLVEFGPGRGTMMADIRRSIAAAKWVPDIGLIETSPTLAAAQSKRHPGSAIVADLGAVADDTPAFFVANEFFDALPVRQFERTAAGWRERTVVATATGLTIGRGCADAVGLVPATLAGAPDGSVVEVSPTATAVAAEIGARLAGHGGAALIVDYGHAGPVTGDTLQAVRAHAAVDWFVSPGEVDLTCHVDFTALATAAATGGKVRAWGPVAQGAFLQALGIDARAAVLKRSATAEQASAIDAAVARLTGGDAMGQLFKVMALTPAGADAPPGFA